MIDTLTCAALGPFSTLESINKPAFVKASGGTGFFSYTPV